MNDKKRRKPGCPRCVGMDFGLLVAAQEVYKLVDDNLQYQKTEVTADRADDYMYCLKCGEEAPELARDNQSCENPCLKFAGVFTGG